MTTRGIAPGLLLAMPQLRDPNFERAVVLMVEHTDHGSFGLILNRPTSLRIAEVMSSLDVAWTGNPDAVVWYGGPVMPGTGWLLHPPSTDPADGGVITVGPGIELSTSPEQLRALAAQPPAGMRFLMGYSGWGSAQLEGELVTSSWLTADATPELVFGTPPEQMWDAATRSLGIDPTTLVPAAGVH